MRRFAFVALGKKLESQVRCSRKRIELQHRFFGNSFVIFQKKIWKLMRDLPAKK